MSNCPRVRGLPGLVIPAASAPERAASIRNPLVDAHAPIRERGAVGLSNEALKMSQPRLRLIRRYAARPSSSSDLDHTRSGSDNFGVISYQASSKGLFSCPRHYPPARKRPHRSYLRRVDAHRLHCHAYAYAESVLQPRSCSRTGRLQRRGRQATLRGAARIGARIHAAYASCNT